MAAEKTTQVNVRVDPALRETLEKAAAQEGINLSGYVRRQLLLVAELAPEIRARLNAYAEGLQKAGLDWTVADVVEAILTDWLARETARDLVFGSGSRPMVFVQDGDKPMDGEAMFLSLVRRYLRDFDREMAAIRAESEQWTRNCDRKDPGPKEPK